MADRVLREEIAHNATALPDGAGAVGWSQRGRRLAGDLAAKPGESGERK